MFCIEPWDTTTSLYQQKRPFKTGSQTDLLFDHLQICLLKVFSNPQIFSQGPCKLPSQTHFELQPTCQESILLCHWRNCHFKTRQKNHVTLEQQQKNLVCMNYFADNSDHTHRTSQGTLRDHRHVLFFHPVFHVRTCIKILQVSLA